MLYFVPTPVGNLDDMTFRAVEVLKTSDLILCEDTRVSGKLLKYFQIETPMLAYHQHNEHKLTEEVIAKIKSGENLAIITDAGTPGISDPGFLLARSCVENNIEMSCLPGATAIIPALVNSGLPIDKFVFEGFLPPKKGRQKRLKALKEEYRTMVFYESPYKLLKTLEDFAITFGEGRKMSVSREISKLYEEINHGTVKDIQDIYSNKKPKGEFVLVVEGLNY